MALAIQLMRTAMRAYEMPHGALEYWRPEGLQADGAVKVLHPHSDIQPFGAALSLSLRFSFSLAGATTIHRQQNSNMRALAWLVYASITNATHTSLSTQSQTPRCSPRFSNCGVYPLEDLVAFAGSRSPFPDGRAVGDEVAASGDLPLRGKWGED